MSLSGGLAALAAFARSCSCCLPAEECDDGSSAWFQKVFPDQWSTISQNVLHISVLVKLKGKGNCK